MTSLKHARAQEPGKVEDGQEGGERLAKRHKTEHKSTRGGAAGAEASSSATMGGAGSSSSSGAGAGSNVQGRCLQCLSALDEADLASGEAEPGEHEPQVSCRRCLATCPSCGEEDDFLFPRSKYPLTATSLTGTGESKACRYCLTEDDRKNGRPVLVACRRSECKEQKIDIRDVVQHYQQAHRGFRPDELPVGFVLCPACPREQAIKDCQVFLPALAGRTDRRLLEHSEQRHPMGVFADRLHDAVQELVQHSHRARTDWARRIVFGETEAVVADKDREALELLLEASAKLGAAIDQLPFA
jgi:hypothetical protein